MAELERRKIVIPSPGGNEWSHNADKLKGLHDFVHLAFLAEHPMQFIAKQDGRISKPIWLKIDASAILDSGTRFTNDVSNKTGVALLTADQAMEHIDFEVLFTRTDWKDGNIQARRRQALKSEILIPRIIPIHKILGWRHG